MPSTMNPDTVNEIVDRQAAVAADLQSIALEIKLRLVGESNLRDARGMEKGLPSAPACLMDRMRRNVANCGDAMDTLKEIVNLL